MKRWSLLLTLTALLSSGLVMARAPIAFLLGGLLASLAFAIAGQAPTMRSVWFTASQLLIGVSVGVSMSGSVVETLRDHALLIGVMVVGALSLSLLAGYILRCGRHVTPVTARFASVAGGASGVVAVAQEAGADERVVATVQYLRVMIVVLAMPLVVVALGGTSPPTSGSPWAPYVAGVSTSSTIFVAASAVLALAVLSVVRFPGTTIVVPMFVGVALANVPAFYGVRMPQPLLVFAFATLGVQVGLGFTVSALRAIARLLPLVLVQIGGTILACAALAYGVSRVAGIPLLDAYLASTPGGVFAVAAVAVSSDANVGLIFATQVLRVFVALAIVPLMSRPGPALKRRARPSI